MLFFSLQRSNILIKFTLVPMFVMRIVLMYGVDPGTFTFSKVLLLPNAAWIFLHGEGD